MRRVSQSRVIQQNTGKEEEEQKKQGAEDQVRNCIMHPVNLFDPDLTDHLQQGAPTGLEEFYADASMTPSEYEQLRQLYKLCVESNL